MWQRVMSHVVVMEQITLERLYKLLGASFLQANPVVYASVVDQSIQTAELRNDFRDGVAAIFCRRKLCDNHAARGQLQVKFVGRVGISVKNDRDRSLGANCARDRA